MRVCLDTFRRSAGCRRWASVMPWLLCRCSRRDDRSRCAGDAGPRGGRRAGLVVGARPPPGCRHQPGLEQFQACEQLHDLLPGAEHHRSWCRHAVLAEEGQPRVEVRREVGDDQEAACRHCAHEPGDDLPGIVAVGDEMQHSHQQHGRRQAEVQCAGRPGQSGCAGPLRRSRSRPLPRGPATRWRASSPPDRCPHIPPRSQARPAGRPRECSRRRDSRCR